MGLIRIAFFLLILPFASRSLFDLSSEKSSLLRISDVRPAMEEMLAYHVEHKELSPLLIRRSFKIYSEQFDPYRTYFLEEEIAPFLEPNEERLEKTLTDFRTSRLEEFLSLNRLVEKSILRARQLRREIQKEIVLKTAKETIQKEEAYSTYAKTEGELKERLYKQLLRLVLEEKRISHLEQWSPEDRAKVCLLWQRRFERREEPYLLSLEKKSAPTIC